ncbi:type VI secretion system Vgr family protein [Burkholderia sp. Ac-20379]|uniref:type VI secretion system Vgr family protein n=1 Tax=Burkholderia sp. Ac-20379 TaxID=2703900 RepID=UPI0019819552|nr:type VI secretion system Vgr family protein [Burkholderia sp. Ac-20379]MBN3723571.1 type VI secretion system tip protein VgrG [Burkholderia sp. Ac-20379]
MSLSPLGGSSTSFASSLGSPAGLGGLAGSLASGIASQVGPLAGLTGKIDTLQRATQLAQTGFSLLQQQPGAIANSINQVAGSSATLTQLNRYVTIDTPLGADVLLVNVAVVDEHVNRLPEIHLDLLSHRNDLKAADLIGQQVKLKFDQQSSAALLAAATASSGDDARHFDGYVASFDRVGHPGAVTRYQMSVVPWFWFLTRTTDCRIFQNQTAQDILAAVFAEHGFSDYAFDIQGTQKPIEYIVMYQESYFNFCARLMEQEGLVWTHRYEEGKHTLAIGDSNNVFRAIDRLSSVPYSDSASSEYNGIDQLNRGSHFAVGKVTFRDFNYHAPSSPLMLVESSTTLNYARLHSTERFEHQSLYDLSADGDRYARYAIEAEEALAQLYTGQGYAWRMTTAGHVAVAGHPVAADNQDYAILQVRHEAVNDYSKHATDLPYRNSFTLLPLKVPYRPQRLTTKPLIQGTQSAIVVGPKGEEIYTNGSCVKLHFLWDRRGKQDGTDSMWVRVSQPWAGAGWGAAAIPRIGQEMLVAFNQGDPDNPVIVGRVYNGEQGNPYDGAAGQTMGIKSQTHKGQGANEIRMTDTNGAQELFVHAQKDMNTVILDSETHQVVGGSRTISVDAGDETKQIAKGNLTETIALQRSTTATTVEVITPAKDGGGGTQIYDAERGILLKVQDSSISLAPEGIRLEHKGSVILMTDDGVMVNGQRIDLNK